MHAPVVQAEYSLDTRREIWLAYTEGALNDIVGDDFDLDTEPRAEA